MVLSHRKLIPSRVTRMNGRSFWLFHGFPSFLRSEDYFVDNLELLGPLSYPLNNFSALLLCSSCSIYSTFLCDGLMQCHPVLEWCSDQCGGANCHCQLTRDIPNVCGHSIQIISLFDIYISVDNLRNG